MKPPHQVVIAFDADIGDAIFDLAKAYHVWLVDTPPNRQRAMRIWSVNRADARSMLFGVTLFARPARDEAQALSKVIELVEDHHGIFAQDPPVDRLLVTGLSPTAEVLSTLNEWGYTRVEKVNDGIQASK